MKIASRLLLHDTIRSHLTSIATDIPAYRLTFNCWWRQERVNTFNDEDNDDDKNEDDKDARSKAKTVMIPLRFFVSSERQIR